MNQKIVVALALAALASASAAQAHGGRCGPFSHLSIILEQNATDADGEVVIRATGQSDGLKELTVWGPDGKRVGEFEGGRNGVGIRQFTLESGEPPNLADVLAAFPEGTYRVKGTTVANGCLKGSAFLSHASAPMTEILTPTEGEIVDPNAFTVSWAPVAAAVGYIVELTDETLGNILKADLTPSQTQFKVPAGWFQPGTEYEVVVGVKAADGNITGVVVMAFTTP